MTSAPEEAFPGESRHGSNPAFPFPDLCFEI
jgi:hypothetical protein